MMQLCCRDAWSILPSVKPLEISSFFPLISFMLFILTLPHIFLARGPIYLIFRNVQWDWFCCLTINVYIWKKKKKAMDFSNFQMMWLCFTHTVTTVCIMWQRMPPSFVHLLMFVFSRTYSEIILSKMLHETPKTMESFVKKY